MDIRLRALAKCSTGTRNESRALHALIHRTGRTLDVAVDTVRTPIKVLKGKPRIAICDYPVLYLSSWLKQKPRFGWPNGPRGPSAAGSGWIQSNVRLLLEALQMHEA